MLAPWTPPEYYIARTRGITATPPGQAMSPGGQQATSNSQPQGGVVDSATTHAPLQSSIFRDLHRRYGNADTSPPPRYFRFGHPIEDPGNMHFAPVPHSCGGMDCTHPAHRKPFRFGDPDWTRPCGLFCQHESHKATRGPLRRSNVYSDIDPNEQPTLDSITEETQPTIEDGLPTDGPSQQINEDDYVVSSVVFPEVANLPNARKMNPTNRNEHNEPQPSSTARGSRDRAPDADADGNSPPAPPADSTMNVPSNDVESWEPGDENIDMLSLLWSPISPIRSPLQFEHEANEPEPAPPAAAQADEQEESEAAETDIDEPTDDEASPEPLQHRPLRPPVLCQARHPGQPGNCNRWAAEPGTIEMQCPECGRVLCPRCCKKCQMSSQCGRWFCLYHCGGPVTIGDRAIWQALIDRQRGRGNQRVTERNGQQTLVRFNNPGYNWPNSPVPDRALFFHNCDKYRIKDRQVGERRQLQFPHLNGHLRYIDPAMDDVCTPPVLRPLHEVVILDRRVRYGPDVTRLEDSPAGRGIQILTPLQYETWSQRANREFREDHYPNHGVVDPPVAAAPVPEESEQSGFVEPHENIGIDLGVLPDHLRIPSASDPGGITAADLITINRQTYDIYRETVRDQFGVILGPSHSPPPSAASRSRTVSPPAASRPNISRPSPRPTHRDERLVNTQDLIQFDSWIATVIGTTVIEMILWHELDIEADGWGIWNPATHWSRKHCGQGCGCCRSHNPEDGSECEPCFDTRMLLYTCRSAAKAITQMKRRMMSGDSATAQPPPESADNAAPSGNPMPPYGPQQRATSPPGWRDLPTGTRPKAKARPQPYTIHAPTYELRASATGITIAPPPNASAAVWGNYGITQGTTAAHEAFQRQWQRLRQLQQDLTDEWNEREDGYRQQSSSSPSSQIPPPTVPSITDQTDRTSTRPSSGPPQCSDIRLHRPPPAGFDGDPEGVTTNRDGMVTTIDINASWNQNSQEPPAMHEDGSASVNLLEPAEGSAVAEATPGVVDSTTNSDSQAADPDSDRVMDPSSSFQ